MVNKNTILYVDDEEINLKLFQMNFMSQFSIVTAESAEEGLAVLKRDESVVLVVTDMRMPEMDGMEFIKLAKEMCPELKFMILTGFEISSEIEDAIEHGIVLYYFRKPLDHDLMGNALELVLNND